MAYELNGIEYPSVTTVLGLLDKSGALTYWSARCATEYIAERKDLLFTDQHSFEQILRDATTAFQSVSKEALDTGSITHNMIEQYVKTGADQHSSNDQAQNSFLAFLEWEELNHVVWEQSEMTLFETINGYAGTCDAVALVNGVRYLIDFKTSKSIYDEYKTQLAAYLRAYNLTNSEQIERVGILRLDKETGEPEFKDCSKNISVKERAFLKLLDFYYADKKRRLRNNPFVKAYH
jgi:hypothetical protein